MELDLVLSGFRARVGHLKTMLNSYETERYGGVSMNKLTYQGTYSLNPAGGEEVAVGPALGAAIGFGMGLGNSINNTVEKK